MKGTLETLVFHRLQKVFGEQTLLKIASYALFALLLSLAAAFLISQLGEM